MNATGTFEMKTWDEKTSEGAPWDWKHWRENPHVQLTRAHIVNTFTGDVEGESTLEYLMTYGDDGSCTFTGQERITGSLGDRSGSFVLQQHGTFKADGIEAEWFVIPGSGTGELRGLKGQGGFTWEGQEGNKTRFTLDYDFG
ncbi:MAG TPA: DUF3224 domain-containing protein [Rhodothermales bacterium]|nr:DUF3224 domain-containing protein [Rhodothermales bacterium]